MSSSWSSRLTLSMFGQSHGPAVGMTLEGLPAGEAIDLPALQAFLDRRAPGRNAWSSTRREPDIPAFLAGLTDGRTNGAPITATIQNRDARPADYDADVPRPGHADLTARQKYGASADLSGGGHLSGRLTAPLCVAGGLCLQVLARRGIRIGAHIAAIADVHDEGFDPVRVAAAQLDAVQSRALPVLRTEAGEEMTARIAAAQAAGDSLGGVIECAVLGLPPGLGDPLFDGMENRIARLAFAVPAVKGIEFGAGFHAATLRGSEHNDALYWHEDEIRSRTNRHGGILGGITSGMPLLFRVAIKPTPSIAQAQESVSLSRREGVTLTLKGRHDPCIVPRAVPCMEAVAALAVLDALLAQEGGARGWT